MIGLQRQLGHQLGPAVHIVRVVRRLHVFFAQVNFLVGVGLHVIGIDAAGGGVDNFFDACFHGFPENHAVEEKIGGGAGLMQVHVAAAAVIGGEMKNDLNAFHGGASDAGLAQIGFDEGDLPRFQMPFDIARRPLVRSSTTMHLGAARDKSVDEMRTDEGCSSGDKNFLIIPDGALRYACDLLLLFYDRDEFFKLIHSSIFFRGFPGAAAHVARGVRGRREVRGWPPRRRRDRPDRRRCRNRIRTTMRAASHSGAATASTGRPAARIE